MKKKWKADCIFALDASGWLFLMNLRKLKTVFKSQYIYIYSAHKDLEWYILQFLYTLFFKVSIPGSCFDVDIKTFIKNWIQYICADLHFFILII